jgi:hypothetical protein
MRHVLCLLCYKSDPELVWSLTKLPLLALVNHIEVDMTAQDHNRTITIIYSVLGLLLAGTAIVLLVRDLRQKDWLLAIYKDELFIASSVLSTCLLSTVYGMLRRRRWARVLALVTTIFYVWLFPLGTLLAVYLWWFLHSQGAKTLYKGSAEPDR